MTTNVRLEQDIINRLTSLYTESDLIADLNRYYNSFVNGLLIKNVLHEFSTKDRVAIAYYALCKSETEKRYKITYFDNMLAALGFETIRGYSATFQLNSQMPYHYEILAYMLKFGIISMNEYNEAVKVESNII